MSTFDAPDAVCDRETAKAIHVVAADATCWIPKAVIHDDSEVYSLGDEGTLVVHMWWAEKEGLI